jgi:hypothetical protein
MAMERAQLGAAVGREQRQQHGAAQQVGGVKGGVVAQGHDFGPKAKNLL